MMTVREMLHQRERDILVPWAAKSAESRGRLLPEEPDPLRTDFQRDRDRVIHSRAFRRLAHKTQVFILANQDHVRTRLTHTLEVAQVAKTIARALCLNEDLTEAIALAHDLGHTAFGHAGEYALDEVVRDRAPSERFLHWEQSLRVVDSLENNGRGLNLTQEVREGILGHTKGRADLAASSTGTATLESQAVKIADRIAYVNHDLEDAIRARVLSLEDVPGDLLDALGHTHSARIGTIVSDIVTESENVPELRISPRILEAINAFKEFLFERVYSPNSEGETRRVRTVIGGLYNYYYDRALESAAGGEQEDGAPRANASLQREDGLGEASGFDGPEAGEGAPWRRACDYVAGMTDRFAVQRYTELFIPESLRFEES